MADLRKAGGRLAKALDNRLIAFLSCSVAIGMCIMDCSHIMIRLDRSQTFFYFVPQTGSARLELIRVSLTLSKFQSVTTNLQ